MDAIQIISKDNKGNLFTAKTFLHFLRKSNDYWWEENPEICNWFFRGQWDSDWSLTPSLYRESNHKLTQLIKKVTQKYRNEKDSYSDSEFKYRVQSAAGDKAVYDFTILARKLGFNISQDKHILDPITYNGLNGYPGDIFEKHLLLAQHHGIPTRLLDWTEDPIFAAYFSIAREFRTPKTPDFTCVWAFNKKRFSNAWIQAKGKHFAINEYYDFNYGNKYITSQHGLFIGIEGETKQYYIKNNKFPSLDHIVELQCKDVKINQPVLLKILLQKNEINNLLKILNREDVNQAKLMPSLDKVGQTIFEKYEYM